MRQSQEILTIQNKLVQLLQQYELESVTDKRIFLNKKTLRLTSTGYKLFKKHYTCWEFDQPPNKAGQVIELLKKMKYPYYTNSKRIVLFNEQDAFMCKLAGTEGWLSGKS